MHFLPSRMCIAQGEPSVTGERPQTMAYTQVKYYPWMSTVGRDEFGANASNAQSRIVSDKAI